MRRPPVVASTLAVALVLAGCAAGDGGTTAEQAGSAASSPATTSPAPTSPTTPSQDAGVVVRTGPSEYGRMLFDRSGQAIYLFDKESTDRPECYRACAQAWPPVLTDGPPRAAGSVRPALLGTTRRADGSSQVTYAGHPLYYYAHEGPNQVLCHEVTEFGGLWLVVTPSGDPA